jgi:hypothetical protein
MLDQCGVTATSRRSALSKLRQSRVASPLLSAAWVVAAAIVFVVADFTADKLWGAGLTGLVALATLSVAATGRQRQPRAQDSAEGC